MKNLVKFAFIIAIFSNLLQAENQQEYSMNKALCEKYIQLSRVEVDNYNLSLALAYAKKAIQSNSWDNLAWANYNDIIQRLADEGDIIDFGTAVEESQAGDAPSADAGEVQFEGC